jgi:2-C-methyl-D-erythritol 4-phosphate cytidylyltransferase
VPDSPPSSASPRVATGGDHSASTGPIWGIVVAAGLGQRFGAEKQFLSLCDRPMCEWAVAAVRSVADGVVLVVPAGRAGDWALMTSADVVVTGGKTRAASVRSGLQAVPAEAAIIVVHDAARPLASEALFHVVVAAVAGGAEAAIPGVPVLDTVKAVTGGVVDSTLDRTNLVRVQTPQAFRASTLRRGHAGEPEATDDAAVVEALGVKVVVVPGEEANVKITAPADLELLEWRLSARHRRSP